MALREFVDGSGVGWRVWHTAPERTAGLADDYREGWLTFDNGSERRRLVPVPTEWWSLGEERLRLLLRAAVSPALSHPHPERRARDRREGDRRTGERRGLRPDRPPGA
jgi:hypothetical protein